MAGGSGNTFFEGIVYFLSLIYIIMEIIFKKYNAVHIQSFKIRNVETKLYMSLRYFVKYYVYTAHNILSHEFDRGEKET